MGPNFIFLTILLTTAVSIGYFILMSYIITNMDKRYFIRRKSKGKNADVISILSSGKSSVIFIIEMAKILIGIGLLVCGIIMLVLPGQGLITMLIGLSLIPFPGKNELEQNLLSRKSVRSSLNWIRAKANKEPFIFD
nr:PGPGW domain-containing protein [Paraglaciecola sp. 20A4]